LQTRYSLELIGDETMLVRTYCLENHSRRNPANVFGEDE